MAPRHRLALVDLAELGDPAGLAGGCVYRHRPVVERVEEDGTVGINRAAIDDVAAGDALRGREWLRLELPFHRRAGLGEIERIQHIRKRRDDVHRAVHDERWCFVTSKEAGREDHFRTQLLH